jgi:hypothetical protein
MFLCSQNIEFTRNQHIFKNSYLFKNYKQKNVLYYDNYKHLL